MGGHQYVLEYYKKKPDKSKFFRPDFFDKLTGTSELRKQIIAGNSEAEIRKTWEKDLESY